jgi:hypothetical protein
LFNLPNPDRSRSRRMAVCPEDKKFWGCCGWPWATYRSLANRLLDRST